MSLAERRRGGTAAALLRSLIAQVYRYICIALKLPCAFYDVFISAKIARGRAFGVAPSHREAAVQRRQTLAQLAISKNRQAEEEAEERCEQACLHNPAGGVDLVIIPRPKRFAKLNKNPDGSDIIRERKRTRAEISAAADAEMLKNLKKSISRDDGPPAKGKRKAAGTADRLPAKKQARK
ncbi:hypothetical protein B0H13DRAFT_2340365 [Mycena leptocephala]|nr:hypothetical protein B0H13DRAFT_2340365 [Mycena leptocephala]